MASETMDAKRTKVKMATWDHRIPRSDIETIVAECGGCIGNAGAVAGGVEQVSIDGGQEGVRADCCIYTYIGDLSRILYCDDSEQIVLVSHFITSFAGSSGKQKERRQKPHLKEKGEMTSAGRSL